MSTITSAQAPAAPASPTAAEPTVAAVAPINPEPVSRPGSEPADPKTLSDADLDAALEPQPETVPLAPAAAPVEPVAAPVAAAEPVAPAAPAPAEPAAAAPAALEVKGDVPNNIRLNGLKGKDSKTQKAALMIANDFTYEQIVAALDKDPNAPQAPAAEPAPDPIEAALAEVTKAETACVTAAESYDPKKVAEANSALVKAHRGVWQAEQQVVEQKKVETAMAQERQVISTDFPEFAEEGSKARKLLSGLWNSIPADDTRWEDPVKLLRDTAEEAAELIGLKKASLRQPASATPVVAAAPAPVPAPSPVATTVHPVPVPPPMSSAQVRTAPEPVLTVEQILAKKDKMSPAELDQALALADAAQEA